MISPTQLGSCNEISNGNRLDGVTMNTGLKTRGGMPFRMTNGNGSNEEVDGLTRPASHRRTFFRDVIGFVAITSYSSVTNAAMKSDQTVFKAGKDLTVDEAKARFKEGQASLDDLLKNYDEICEGGGDNVRRYLGTVGTSSGLYGIAKVMKTLQGEADDIVEYTEVMNEVNSALVGADGSAYMAIFTETSTSGVPPKKYYDDAKIEVKRAIASMQEIAKQLNIR